MIILGYSPAKKITVHAGRSESRAVQVTALGPAGSELSSTLVRDSSGVAGFPHNDSRIWRTRCEALVSLPLP